MHVHAWGMDTEVLENFTYFGNVVRNDGGSSREVVQRIGMNHSVMDSPNMST